MAKYIDMSGIRFNWLTVLSTSGRKGSKLIWECVCDCGNKVFALGESIRSGNTKSCGCWQKNAARNAQTTHGLSKSLTHRIWCGMLTRCRNKNHQSFKNYGAKGIEVCDRWLSFSNFVADMGECPDGNSIDRIDSTKGYFKENCRWANNLTQSRNQPSNTFLTLGGETKCISEWAALIGINRSTINRRIKRGIPINEVLKK